MEAASGGEGRRIGGSAGGAAGGRGAAGVAARARGRG